MPIATELFWIIVLVLSIGNYLFRLSFIALFGQREIPPALERVLRFVPVAVLPALVVPAFVLQAGAIHIGPGNLRLLAGILAGIAAWKTENLLMTLGVGMGSLWILQALS